MGRFKGAASRLSLLIAVAGSTAAQAAEGAATVDLAESEVTEVVVTATKREQRLQEVPLAVSAISGAELAERGVADVQSLQQISPSLTAYEADNSSNSGVLRIRGVGTTGTNVGLEAAVGVYIDGVYIPRSGQAFSDLLDVERVEVLRGPQGTLFGKNTSAGVVQVVTRRPSFDPAGFGEVSVGNLDTLRITGGVTGPIVEDRIAYRLSGYRNQREGFIRNDTGTSDFNDRDRWGLRGQLLFIPAQDIDLRIIGDYRESDEICCAAVYTRAGPVADRIRTLGGHIATAPDADDRRVAFSFDPFEKIKDRGVSAELGWSLAQAKLDVVAAWRDFRVRRDADVDYVDLDILRPPGTVERFENRSLEARLSGQRGALAWLAGAYVYDETLHSRQRLELGTDFSRVLGLPAVLLPAGAGNDRDHSQTTNGWAVFTHDTLTLGRFDLTLGLRYTDETKEGRVLVNDAPPGAIVNEPFCAILPGVLREALATACDNRSFAVERSEGKLSGTLNLAYRVTPDVMTYASYSRGFKSGGVNFDPTARHVNAATGAQSDTALFPSETVDAWEVGLKAAVPRWNLVLNTAAFHSRFENFQVVTLVGVTTSVSTADEVVSTGAEVEGSWRPTPWATLSGGVTYANTQYGDDLGPLFATREGARLSQSPLWAANLGVDIEEPQRADRSWRWAAGANVAYRGRVNTGSDLDPAKVQEEFTTVNARLGLRADDWELTAWVNNLTDYTQKTLVMSVPFQTGSYVAYLGAPRTFGVTLKRRFGRP